ncbi:Phototropin [Lachnellula occidentalis]|uniref:Phototropin n=1 Tax=Lachnellula occidentalis TaxID=215460 RepID=A0A8H8UJS9_9HELO|nr:Phototropin [Lachnellula occidentalis]
MAAEIRNIPFHKPEAYRAYRASPTQQSFDEPPRPGSSHVRTLQAQKDARQPFGFPGQPLDFPERVSSKEYRARNEVESPVDSSGDPALSTFGSEAFSQADTASTYQTTVASPLLPLQLKGQDEHDRLEPLGEEDIDPGSFDLVAPPDAGPMQYSLETRSEQLFSTEHLQLIFSDPSLLLRFTAFLSASRASSVPLLVYYLDAIKALKAIKYANAIAEALDPIDGLDFTSGTAKTTLNEDLEQKAKLAFDAMVREDLPAYVAHLYIQTVSVSIQKRITGTLPPHLRESSEGLAEVFCLTDPSRPDNPIVFASEGILAIRYHITATYILPEFHRTTQYGMSYVIGRNCRFLQGPKTSTHSVRRLRDTLLAGKEHYEVFLNYWNEFQELISDISRRDGSPFMNLLMMAPLCDSRGTIRYFIGAQVDVSGLVKECSDMESLHRLVIQSENDEEMKRKGDRPVESPPTDEFQELSGMLNLQELDTVRKFGGSMHKEAEEEHLEINPKAANWNKPRLLINHISDDTKTSSPRSRVSGKLTGIYENYLLVRPYPSLRILFASPTLRVPGILQSPFMARIGGSNRVRDELTQAFADGRGVTAKVRWVTKQDSEGRNRWIHCTPLQGSNGSIGVWMVVIVDEETNEKRYKMAPPVDLTSMRSPTPLARHGDASLRDFALDSGGRSREPSLRGQRSIINYDMDDQEGGGSLYSLRI